MSSIDAGAAMSMHHASESPICRHQVLQGLAALTTPDLSACATRLSPVPSAASSLGRPQDATPGADIDPFVNCLTLAADDTKLESASRLGTAACCRERFAASASDALPVVVQAQIDAFSIENRPLADLQSDAEGLREAVEAVAGEDGRAMLGGPMARSFDLGSGALDPVYPGVKPHDQGLL